MPASSSYSAVLQPMELLSEVDDTYHHYKVEAHLRRVA